MYTYEMKMLSVKKRSGNANYAINNTCIYNTPTVDSFHYTKNFVTQSLYEAHKTNYFERSAGKVTQFSKKGKARQMFSVQVRYETILNVLIKGFGTPILSLK